MAEDGGGKVAGETKTPAADHTEVEMYFMQHPTFKCDTSRAFAILRHHDMTTFDGIKAFLKPLTAYEQITWLCEELKLPDAFVGYLIDKALGDALDTAYEVTPGADGAEPFAVCVEKCLGSGATSSVYLVLRRGDGDQPRYALKLYNEEQREGSLGWREWQTLKALQSKPWCVTVVGTVGGVDGEPLQGIVMEPVAVPITHEVGMSGDLFSQLIGALYDMHEAGFCHRDVRISNLAVTTDDPPQLVLLDMGGCVRLGDTPTVYHGTFYTAADSVLAARADGQAPRATRSSDLVAAVRTAYLLSAPQRAYNFLYDVPCSEHGTMLQAWQECCPAAWKAACNVAAGINETNCAEERYKDVIDTVWQLLPFSGSMPQYGGGGGAAAAVAARVLPRAHKTDTATTAARRLSSQLATSPATGAGGDTVPGPLDASENSEERAQLPA